MKTLEVNLHGAGFFRISITGEKIAALTKIGNLNPHAPFANPGLVDIQVNGMAGVDFSSPDLDAGQLESVLPRFRAAGVTSFCPTLITNSIDQLKKNLSVLENARREIPTLGNSIPGYHLEGPYLSAGPSRGAHNPEFMHDPDWDEFQSIQKAAGGNIRIITLAPELPGAIEFIRRASAAGVRVALSHTDGGADDIHRAVDAGATLSTHLGNGCPQLLDRHRTPLWAQLSNAGLHAGIICDGFHLVPDFVKLVHQVKTAERCILVSDAVHVCGLPPGRYSLVGREIELLPSGKVIAVGHDSLAGSTLTMDRAVANFREMTGLPLHTALKAASTVPARYLNSSPPVCSEIAVRQPANLILYREHDEGFHLEKTILSGKVVYSSN